VLKASRRRGGETGGLHDEAVSSLVDIGGVMFLLALSAVFGYGIVFERIPEVISTWMLGVTDSAGVVMVLIFLPRSCSSCRTLMFGK